MKYRAKRNGGDGNEDVSTQIRDLATLTPVVMKEKPSVIDEDISTPTRDLATLTPVVMKEKSAEIDPINQSFDEDGEFTKDRDPSVLNSKKDEILQVYQEEKEKHDKFLNKLSRGYSLYIFNVGDNLMLMVHYIDDSWERQKKIISFIPKENYIQEMKKSCLDSKIDRNICSIRHDGCIKADDEEIIESWFSQRGSFPFTGVGLDFPGFCYKIELLINQWEMNEIDGLQECVDYGYKASSNNLKLMHAVNNAKTMGKKVIFNGLPFILNLHGPFEYLEHAVRLKEVFNELEKIDSDFINLTNQKWDEVTATLEHFHALIEFVDDFRMYNYSSITTTVVHLLKLFRFHNSEDCQVCKNVSYKKLFDKIQIYLVIVILDPRFKMDTVQRWYKEIYDSDADGYLEKTLRYFRDVYNKYAKDYGEYYNMMEAIGRPCKSSTKSEIDLYLHHLKVPTAEEFDILAWWRDNTPFYPILSRMAHDYLAIPIII